MRGGGEVGFPLLLWALAIGAASAARRPVERKTPLTFSSGAAFLAERPRIEHAAAIEFPVLAAPRRNASASGQEQLAGMALPQSAADHAHGSHGHSGEEEAHGHGGGHAEEAHGHGGDHAAEAHDHGRVEEAHGHGHADESHGHSGKHAEEVHDHGAEEPHGHGHDEEAHGHEHAEEAHGHGGHAEDAHGHDDGHGHEEAGHGHTHHFTGAGAHSVAVGLIATVVIIPIVMYMAMSDWLIATLTFKMLDTFTAIFLAVLWFNTFSQFLDTFDIKEAFPLAREFFSTLQCLVLYGIALSIAYFWRNETLAMTTFCSVGAHFIAFSGILASTQTQRSVSKVPPHEWEPLASFAFCLFVMAFIAGISAVTWFTWRRDVKHDKLNHGIEHLELDIAGLVVSFAITQAVRHAIMGKYPPPSHLLLQEAASEDHGHVHKEWQVWFMFLWAAALTVVAGLSLPKLEKLAVHGPWAARGVHVLKVVLIMLVAWGYLLWGEWAFYERMFRGDMMFGHMVFSVIATLVCLAVLYIMAVVSGRWTSPQAMETQDITITGISLVAAWSWEHCFNVALDVIGEEYQVGYKGLVPKLVLAILIPAVLLPTYVRHIRTRVIDIEQHEHGHGHADGHSHGQEGHDGEGHGEISKDAGEAPPEAARAEEAPAAS